MPCPGINNGEDGDGDQQQPPQVQQQPTSQSTPQVPQGPPSSNSNGENEGMPPSMDAMPPPPMPMGLPGQSPNFPPGGRSILVCFNTSRFD